MTNNNFTFSIIIAVYNAEKYLVETIESVINQTFDFKNTQIILVDNGSTDKSKDICLDYNKKYPDNITYLYQKKSGKATARNNGLDTATGKYVNFLDSDDKLDLNVLQDVFELFENANDLIDVAVIPGYDPDAEDLLFLNYKYNNTGVVDIDCVPKVSIIIPVYNTGNLLYECLNSAVNQTLKEIEIICIDDGSSDNSPEILYEYAKKDSRFKIIHQKNQGAGTARNNRLCPIWY